MLLVSGEGLLHACISSKLIFYSVENHPFKDLNYSGKEANWSTIINAVKYWNKFCAFPFIGKYTRDNGAIKKQTEGLGDTIRTPFCPSQLLWYKSN